MTLAGSFGGYLSPAYPSQIVVDATEFCNLACVHCPYVTEVKTKGKHRLHFPVALHDKLVQDITANGKGICQFVRYAGEGEPLLHPHIMDFLRVMSALPMQTSMTTNGLLLDEERCAALVASGVSAVDISLDAAKPDTYAKIRIGGELQDAVAGVRRLLAERNARRSTMKIMTSFIRQAGNTGEEEEFQRFWKQEGVDLVFVRNLHSCAGYYEETAKKIWAAAPKERTPCLYPWERVLLSVHGRVDFCPNEWKGRSGVGDFSAQSIPDIWRGDAMEALRDAHRRNDFSKHALCAQCPDWSVTSWPQQGRTYATAMHEIGEKD